VELGKAALGLCSWFFCEPEIFGLIDTNQYFGKSCPKRSSEREAGWSKADTTPFTALCWLNVSRDKT
jgi:hypothetical protein